MGSYRDLVPLVHLPEVCRFFLGYLLLWCASLYVITFQRTHRVHTVYNHPQTTLIIHAIQVVTKIFTGI